MRISFLSYVFLIFVIILIGFNDSALSQSLPDYPLTQFGTITVTPDLQLNGTGQNVDTIEFWKAPDSTETLMFVSAKDNHLVEVWKYPFEGNQLPPFTHPTFNDGQVNGLVIDQNADLLYVSIGDSSNTVSVFSLPDLTFQFNFNKAGANLQSEPNLAILNLTNGNKNLYVSADFPVYIHDASDGNFINEFTPPNGLETIAPDSFYQRLYIPDENGSTGVYVYNPDGTTYTGNGSNVFGTTQFNSDAEGILLYTFPLYDPIDMGNGFIVVSDQIDSLTDFEFFDRITWEHLGTLRLNGVANTDGIASYPYPLPDYPLGVFAAIDNDNSVAVVGWDKIFNEMLPTITVTSPNGGESWQAGTQHTITWNDNIAENVKIELYKGGSLDSEIVSSTSSNGSYNWDISTNTAANSDFSIVITSVNDANIADTSDASFTIQTPTITVTSPNGGESWVRGFNHQIKWNDNIAENVKIELYKGGVFHSGIEASTPSDGTRNWIIPDTIPVGSDYKVKISKLTDSTVFDISDADFAIGSFELTVPNGVESWAAGSFHQIKFNTVLTDLDHVVDFELWKGGVFDRSLFDTTDADGSKDWNIPNDLTPGSDYRIKIFHHNDPTDYDFSDADFSITPYTPMITVITPNGDEVWQAGTTEFITWTDNIDEAVRIELWKGGVFNSLIIDSTRSDGSKIWDIPAGTLSGTNYKVKIISYVDSSVYDFSEADFTISGSAPQITVTLPNGGESWHSGIEQTITWTDNITENVKIDLYEGGVFQSELFASTFSDGSKFWTIPVTTTPGSDYKIKITSVDSINVFDFSDTTFTIYAPITVTSPNGGESWQAGTQHTITWNDNIAENVKIELFKGGSLDSEIVSSTSSNGSYNWDIPAGIIPASDYTVKITSVDNGIITDQSDAVFDITASSFIIVIAPNGGEGWEAGTQQTITWNDNVAENVKIELFKGGSLDSEIVTSTSSNGSYNWAIPAGIIPALDYTVKITSVSDPGLFDFSNADFSITAASFGWPTPASICFTQVGADNSEVIEFITLLDSMNLTQLKITNSQVNVNGDLVNGDGTFDLSNTNWTNIPGGTFVRLGSDLTNDNDFSDRIIAYDGTGSTVPTLSTGNEGTQLIAYTGRAAQPTYIAGVTWGAKDGWLPDGESQSYAPGTLSDLWLKDKDNYYYKESVDGDATGTRLALTNREDWKDEDNRVGYEDLTSEIGNNYLRAELASLVFTQVGADNPEVIEFITLKALDLTKLKITNSEVNVNGDLVNGDGAFDLSNTAWTNVPSGTFVRLGSNLTNDNDASDRVIAYDGTGSTVPTLSTGSKGTQLIAYNGTAAQPTYIAGITWGAKKGWAPGGNDYSYSYAPGTSSDLWLKDKDNFYFEKSVDGNATETRLAVTNQENWKGDNKRFGYKDLTSEIGNSSLPVELAYFGVTLSANEVQLRWRTETEANNYGFYIERAMENSDWLVLGFVEGNGNSNSPKQYNFSDNSINLSGEYYYRLKQIDNDGTFEYSDVVTVTVGVPILYSLSQNFPNPFNPETKIDYTIPEQQNVSLRVYNMLGELVQELVNELKPAGTYTITFDASSSTSGLPSGVYVYRLQTENYSSNKKMTLLK